MNQDWKVASLINLCDEITDGSHFSPKSKVADEYPYITVRDLTDGVIDFNSCKFIDSDAYTSLVKNGCQPNNGDILFSKDGTVGKVALVESQRKFVVLSSLAIIRPNQKLIASTYLKYALLNPSFLATAIGKKTGVAIRRIILKNLKQIDVSYPTSIAEQKRIVAKLDQAIEAIDKAKANVERNLQNAKDLFQSQLNENFSQKRDGWENVKLSELATDITDGDHMPPPKTKEGVPFITISNINKENHQIDFTNTFTVSDEYYQKLKEKRKPQKGDVLYTVTGSFGIPVVIEHDFKFCFQRHIGLIRPKKDLNSEWLYYWILSPQAILQANDTATGTAQRTVSLTALRNFTIPRIPLKEQQIIVQELNTLSTEVRKLEYNYLQNIFDLDELKKSILQKAFNGEL